MGASLTGVHEAEGALGVRHVGARARQERTDETGCKPSQEAGAQAAALDVPEREEGAGNCPDLVCL